MGGIDRWRGRPSVFVTVLRREDPFPPELPMAVQVEFTSRCNLRCRMCPLTTGSSSSSREPGPMTDVVFDELLRFARRCRNVVLAGYGEPLTNPQCLPMLRALDAEGINVAMATNGISLTPEIARQLVAITHLTLINVSIDSPDPAVYREVRGGSVDRALRGLRNLMAVIDDPARVTVSSVAMRANLVSLGRFPPLLAEIGVQRFTVQALIDYNEFALEERLLDHAEFADGIHEIEVACAQHGIDLELSVPARSHDDVHDPDRARERFYGFGTWDDRFTRQCHVPWDIPFVDKDGRVFACCFAASANERQLGQIGPDTIEDIWTGVAFRNFRRDIVDGRSTPQICRRCTVAPLGRHVFKTWAATILSARVTRVDKSMSTVSITVRNDGELAWTAADHVCIGTAAPRDASSRLADPTWLAPNRPASFLDDTVPPRSITTFEFAVAVPPGVTDTNFEIVADGTCWIPNTRVAVTTRRPRVLPPNPLPILNRSLLAGLRRSRTARSLREAQLRFRRRGSRCRARQL